MSFFQIRQLFLKPGFPVKLYTDRKCERKTKQDSQSGSNKVTEKKHQSSQPLSSSQHPLFNINTAISISRSLSLGLTTALCSGQRSPRIGLLWGPVTHPEEADSGLQSGSGSLNHHDQKVNTAHESITQGGELMALRDPGVSLIQPTNLSDSQIIGNLLDSEEKEIFTLIIHFVHSCISSPSVLPRVRPHWCAQQARKCNARTEMNLSRRTISFSASSPPSVLLFVSPSFCFPHQLCPLTHSGRLVIASLCRFFRSFTVTNSQTHTVTLFTGNAVENKNSG